MSLTESSTVTKSDVNPDVEVSSETSLSQNTHKEGMPRDTRDTNLAGDTEFENTAKGKTSEYSSGFSLSDAARQLQENEGLRLTVRVKSQRRKIMNTQISKGFVQYQNMTSLGEISQKI